MQLIRVRYLPATNKRGSRFSVTNGKKLKIVPLNYEARDDGRYEAAQRFVKTYMPYAPELNPVPGQFNGDNYYHFAPK